MPASSSFTIRHNARTNVLRSACGIAEAFDPTDPVHPEIKEFQAIWDTGATNTCITQAVVDSLGLVATGVTIVQTASGQNRAPTYLVNIRLPNGVGFTGIPVTGCSLGDGFDVLIGMDVIGSGDFAVSTENDCTVMSYRYPASKVIDFVAEFGADQFKENQKALIKHRPAVARKKKKPRGKK